jgi:hypothetical protein
MKTSVITLAGVAAYGKSPSLATRTGTMNARNLRRQWSFDGTFPRRGSVLIDLAS